MPESHYPECPWPNRRKIKGSCRCICDRLRACESRVRAFYEAEIEKQGLQWTESCKQFYRSGSDDGKALGYAAALDAARDAVESHFHAGCDSCDAAFIFGMHALAAIDALKGEA